MDISTVSGVSILGVYACLPDLVLDNAETCRPLYGDSVGTLIKSVGIKKRYIASKGVSSLDLCVEAARRLIVDTGVMGKDIGAVICVTFTPDRLMPANAIGAQARLGLSTNTLAFDIGLACSGYGYGLFVAGLLAKQLQKNVLLLDGDVQSAFVSPLDKGALPVMADAGTATLISPNGCNDMWRFAFYSDGAKREILSIKAGGSKYPVTQQSLEYKPVSDGGQRRDIDIAMDGFGIFSFVAQTVSDLLRQFMQQIELVPDAVDAFVPHQANIYMIRQLAKKLRIPEDKLWVSGDEFGNSASATVPVTIAYVGEKGLTKDSNTILLSGFGGGLSASIGLVTINRTTKLGCFQYQKEGGLHG